MPRIRLTVPDNFPGFVKVHAINDVADSPLTDFYFYSETLANGWQQIAYLPDLPVSGIGVEVPATAPSTRPDSDVTNRPLTTLADFPGGTAKGARGITL